MEGVEALVARQEAQVLILPLARPPGTSGGNIGAGAGGAACHQGAGARGPGKGKD